jgi:transcriptional regulator with XRE-family HTH domain/disulfide bond formation protein DsbB
MNQEVIGSFIAQVRKEKNLTQKELADRIGISDKTVSKWETGNGVPDVSLLQPLCKELSINLNELLSGQRLSEESYNGKAEENMMNLAKDAQEGRNSRKKVGIIGVICGVLVFLFFIEFSIICAAGLGGIWSYIDFPSLIIVTGVLLGIELMGGRLRSIFKALGTSVKGGTTLDEETRRVYLRDLKFAIRATILSTVFAVCIGATNMCLNMDDWRSVGPSFAVLLVGIFYGLILVSLLYAFRERLK